MKKEVSRLAIPAIISGLAEPIVTITDSALVGQISHQSLSAVNLSGLLIMIGVWLCSPLASTITSIAAKNEQKQYHSLIQSGLIIIFLLGISIAGVTALISPFIFNDFYHASDDIYTLALDYYYIRVLGIPFMLATYYLFGVFRGHQNTKWAMQITLLGSGVNILFDILLINGVGNFIPALGVEGAAIASVLSILFMFVCACIYYIDKLNYSIQFYISRSNALLKMMKSSGQLFIRTALLNSVILYSNRIATELGDYQIAAHSIASNLWMFAAYFIDGFANAAMAIAGKLQAKKDIKGLQELLSIVLKKGILISFVSIILFLLIYPFIPSIFNDTPAVIDAFAGIFIFILLSQPINSVAFILDGFLIGLGNMKTLQNAMIYATLCYGFSIFIFTYFFEMNLSYLWICLLLWMLARAATLTIYTSISFKTNR